jgi:hypothetical protein
MSDRKVLWGHEKVMESQLKRYNYLLDKVETNRKKLQQLLKTKGFMGVILNDPDDLVLEKFYESKEKSLQKDVLAIKKECRESQLAYQNYFKGGSVPFNNLKYLWALSDEEKMQ